ISSRCRRALPTLSPRYPPTALDRARSIGETARRCRRGVASLRALPAALDARRAECLSLLAAQVFLVGLVGARLGDRLLLVRVHLGRRRSRRLRKGGGAEQERQTSRCNQGLHHALPWTEHARTMTRTKREHKRYFRGTFGRAGPARRPTSITTERST